jgi:peptidoglycan/LPS O-acetylase OafA/YrhL
LSSIDKIRRITRDGRWIPEIDGLRFVAIVPVFLFHLTGELANRSGRFIPLEPRYNEPAQWLHNGDRGVILFFVISGMILARPFARQWLTNSRPVSLRKYYMRRLTRLEPPYLVALLLFLALFAIYSHGLSKTYLHHALATALYSHNLIYGEMTPVNPVSWSLEIEIQFYLIAPLLMHLFRIRHKVARRLLLVGMIVAVIYLQHLFPPGPRGFMSILNYFQYFLAGLVLADIFVLDLEHMRSSRWWDLAAAAALVALYRLDREFLPTAYILPFAIFVLCLSAMRGITARRFFANRWIAVIGGMCYSIYLTHFMMIAVVFKTTRHFIVPRLDFAGNLLIQILVTGIPVLLFGVVFYLLVERPCMDPDWPSKLWRRLTGQRQNALQVLDSAGLTD